MTTTDTAGVKHTVALGFAQDAVNRKRLVERFNALVSFGNRLTAHVLKDGRLGQGESGVMPDPIDAGKDAVF